MTDSSSSSSSRSLPIAPEPGSPLPCFPCPHGSRCCHWGVSLVFDEPEIFRKLYGDAALVWDEEDSEWRTAVVDGKCVFLKNNACSIHAAPHYPRICRGFPWIDGETGGPYPYDRTICPELDTGETGESGE